MLKGPHPHTEPSTRPATFPSTGAAPNAATTMFAGQYGTSPTDATAVGQAHRGVRQHAKTSQKEDYDYEVMGMGGNKSIGAPTPTSTSSSYAGAMKDDGSLAATVAGRRESDLGTEDGYGGTMDVSIAAQGNELSPEYGMDAAGSMDYDDGSGEAVMGARGSVDGSVGLESRSEGTRGVLKLKSEGEGQEQTPTWSETKTKAGKERKRLPLACIACRRKKIRCSGEKPACKHCLRSRIPCVYKQSARKTAPRTDYMAMLDRRLKRMEERLLKNIPKDEISSVLATTGRSVVKPSSTTSKLGAAGRKRNAETAFGDDIDAWAHSTGSANKQRNVGTEESWGAATSALPRGPDADTDDGSCALPSREIQEHLAEVFFDYVYGQPYLLLHKPSFMRRLRSGTAPAVLVLAICAVSSRFSKHPAVRHDPPFLAGESFAEEARKQLFKNFDNPNITNLTVCIILGLHEFGTCQGGRSWAFGGMATRMAHALQLHKEAECDPMGKANSATRPDYVHEGGVIGGYMSFTDREIRRRCMWACFAMDRFNSSGTERPAVINEEELEIQLPVHDRNLELEIPAITEQLDGGVKDTSDDKDEGKLARAAENMGLGAYLMRVVALYGRVVKYLNQGGREKDAAEIWDPKSRFADLVAELQNFADDTPERFFYTPENLQAHAAEKLAGQFVFLHVAFHQVRLFLHRSALSGPGTPNEQSSRMPKDFAANATETSLDAANKIAQILSDSQMRGVSAVAPFIGYCAFNASLVHIVRMFSPQKKVQQEAKKHMETCLRYLLQLRQYWGLFCSITDYLKMLYRKFSDAFAQGTSIMGYQEAARALQYGDWFRKYPKGVPADEYEESTAKERSLGNDKLPDDDPALSHRSDLQTADEFFTKLGPRRGDRNVPPTRAPARQKPIQHPARSQKSPMSTRHDQSPGIDRSPASNQASIQSSPLQTSPIAIPAPTKMSVSGDPAGKLDAQLSGPSGHVPSQPTDPYAGNLQSHAQRQHGHPNPTVLSSIPQQPSFASYPHPLQRHAMPGTAPGFHPAAQQQPPTSQPYLYDSYPRGSDFVGGVPLNHSLWQGIVDQSMGAMDASSFIDQTSSAWFMPFNSIPPEYDPIGLEAFGSMGGMPTEGIGGDSGRRDGSSDGSGVMASHMMSASSGQVVQGSIPSPHAPYHGGSQ